MAEVAVVGAGIGGLAAAARLARAGHRVTVLEQAPVVGGKLGLFERDGFRFDTGPSLLTLPHLLEDVFSATGAPLDDVLTLRRLDPIARYRFGDGARFDAAATEEAIVAGLDALGRGNGDDWRSFMRRAEAIWEVTRKPFLESPLRGWSQLARMAVRTRDLRTVAPLRTLRGIAKDHFRDPRLVTFVDRYATYTGSDPRRAPAALASIPFVEWAYGGWYVEGGLRGIGDALRARAESLGVEVRTGAEVEGIDVASGRVTGVRLADGSRVPAEVVVANADAAHVAHDLLPADAGTSLRRRVARAQPSLSGFVVCLAVRGTTPGVAQHNVFFPERYDDEFDDLFGDRPRPVRDPTVFVTVPSDPAVAPPGHEAWFVLVNAPRHVVQHDPSAAGRSEGIDWDAPGLADAEADRVLAVLASRGLDVRDRVVFREVRTPADLARRTRAVGGSIYGTSSNGPRAAFLRPPNRTDVGGLFLVGGSSHPGGGIPLVLLSAGIVARLVGPA